MKQAGSVEPTILSSRQIDGESEAHYPNLTYLPACSVGSRVVLGDQSCVPTIGRSTRRTKSLLTLRVGSGEVCIDEIGVGEARLPMGPPPAGLAERAAKVMANLVAARQAAR